MFTIPWTIILQVFPDHLLTCSPAFLGAGETGLS